VPSRSGDEFSKRGSVFTASILEAVAASGASPHRDRNAQAVLDSTSEQAAMIPANIHNGASRLGEIDPDDDAFLESRLAVLAISCAALKDFAPSTATTDPSARSKASTLFINSQGWGFIICPDNGGADVFVHTNQVEQGSVRAMS
jgi:hypothetical protein